MMTLKGSVMSEENNEGQVIYLHAAQVFWHTKLGKKLVVNTKGSEDMPINNELSADGAIRRQKGAQLQGAKIIQQ